MIDLLWFMVAILQALAGVVPPLQRAAAGMARIQEVLDAHEEVTERPGARPLPRFCRRHRVAERELRATAARRRPWSHVSVTIRAGESIAIVGPSGSGKSTLLGLLLRLHDPSDGAITVDGHDHPHT